MLVVPVAAVVKVATSPTQAIKSLGLDTIVILALVETHEILAFHVDAKPSAQINLKVSSPVGPVAIMSAGKLLPCSTVIKGDEVDGPS